MKMQLPQSTIDKLMAYRRANAAWTEELGKDGTTLEDMEGLSQLFHQAQRDLAIEVDVVYQLQGDKNNILPGSG